MKQRNAILKYLSVYFLCFVFYSFLGWIYEVTLALLYGWGFVNRGFLFGPWLPVYGFGSLILILTLQKIKSKPRSIGKLPITPLLVFFLILFITTTLELATSYLMEFIFHVQLWDYSHYFMNFQGRISLSASVRFGIGGMIILYLLQPAFEKFQKKLTAKRETFISLTLFVLFLLDLIIKLISH